jgi:hypothetical protein
MDHKEMVGRNGLDPFAQNVDYWQALVKLELKFEEFFYI